MSIWGAVQSSEQIFRGCRYVSTSSHGGIILTANSLKNNSLLELLRTYPDIESYYHKGSYYFEQDCDADMVLYLLSDEIISAINPNKSPEDIRMNCLKTFVEYNPDYFTHVTNKGLSIFDSPVLMNRLVKSNPENYTIVSARSNSFNIPKGFTYFVVHNNLNQKMNFIAPKEEYERMRKLSFLPVDVSKYKSFTLDEDLPLSKPKVMVENGYLVCNSRREQHSDDIQVVKAYSYQTEDYKYFRMTAMFEKSLKQMCDSRVWIKYTDSSHTKMADDLDVFVREVTKTEFDNAVQFIQLNKVA